MSSIKNKAVILIEGPTAVGKTAVAITLAKHFKTEIISADSRQCYKELVIGVARPSEKELREVKHHFIAAHSVNDDVNAALFEKFALEKTDELFEKYNRLLMVGGTGLYIKAFCEGLDDIPSIDPGIRDQVAADYEKKGMSWLQQTIRLKDPEF